MKIIFAGNSRFAEITLKEIIKKGVVPSLVLSDKDDVCFKAAESEGVNVKSVETKDSFHETIKKEDPDLVIVASFGVIIDSKTLSLAEFVNLHPSLLPLYRGSSPIQTAIMEGVERSGVTVIEMSEEVDSGPILSSKEALLGSKITYPEAEELLAKEGSALLSSVVSNMENIEKVEQDHSKATYTKKMTREDGRIDWNKSAQEIERRVRALNPWPGTFSETDMGRIKILEAYIQEQTNHGPFGEVGKTYLATNSMIAVQTGRDFLLISKLQMEGKNPVSAKEFLNGNIGFVGTVLK